MGSTDGPRFWSHIPNLTMVMVEGSNSVLKSSISEDQTESCNVLRTGAGLGFLLGIIMVNNDINYLNLHQLGYNMI